MEVREVGDPKPVELRGQVCDLELADPQPHPAGLEPAVCEQDGGERHDGARDSNREAQIWSFSMIGLTETTCRRKRSSHSSRPAATPTSCERCRIGIA